MATITVCDCCKQETSADRVYNADSSVSFDVCKSCAAFVRKLGLRTTLPKVRKRRPNARA